MAQKLVDRVNKRRMFPSSPDRHVVSRRIFLRGSEVSERPRRPDSRHRRPDRDLLAASSRRVML